MKITNANTSYLMFLAYLILTEFEFSLCIVAVGHSLRAFCLRRPSTSGSSDGRFTKIVSFFLFFFPISPSVLLFILTFLAFFFFFFFWGGGGLVGGLRVGSTLGLLPDNTSIQREMNIGEGATIQHYYSLNITRVNLTSRSECDFQTVILTFTIS